MKQLSEHARVFRNQLEHLAHLNSVYLRYRCDGVGVQEFQPTATESTQALPIKSVVVWSQLVVRRNHGLARMTLCYVSVPNKDRAVVEGVIQVVEDLELKPCSVNYCAGVVHFDPHMAGSSVDADNQIINNLLHKLADEFPDELEAGLLITAVDTAEG